MPIESRRQLNNRAGFTNVLTLVAMGVTIAIAAVGGFVAQSNITDSKIEIVRAQSVAQDTAMLQRISTQEQKSTDIDNRLTRIENKVDSIISTQKDIISSGFYSSQSFLMPTPK